MRARVCEREGGEEEAEKYSKVELKFLSNIICNGFKKVKMCRVHNLLYKIHFRYNCMLPTLQLCTCSPLATNSPYVIKSTKAESLIKHFDQVNDKTSPKFQHREYILELHASKHNALMVVSSRSVLLPDICYRVSNPYGFLNACLGVEYPPVGQTTAGCRSHPLFRR